MKKLYFPLLCLFLFASCSPHLITQGITDKTSNYVVTTGGQQINLPSVSIDGTAVTGDTARYNINNLSAIKQGHAYYGVQNGVVYDGVYYGKLMLLRRYAGTEYDMSNHTSHAVYSYYLQKQGQASIVFLTGSSLIDNVRDNPLALRKAKAARIFGTINTVSLITTFAGLGCVFLHDGNPIKTPAVMIGLFSMPTFLITLPITSHKRYKAIRVYNR